MENVITTIEDIIKYVNLSMAEGKNHITYDREALLIMEEQYDDGKNLNEIIAWVCENNKVSCEEVLELPFFNYQKARRNLRYQIFNYEKSENDNYIPIDDEMAVSLYYYIDDNDLFGKKIALGNVVYGYWNQDIFDVMRAASINNNRKMKYDVMICDIKEYEDLQRREKARTLGFREKLNMIDDDEKCLIVTNSNYNY